MLAWDNVQIWGQTIFCDFMVSNETEQFTEDISSVQTESIYQSLRHIENLLMLSF